MIIVQTPDVPFPAFVRYAWADNPDVNLVNEAGLPPSSFRTDALPQYPPLFVPASLAPKMEAPEPPVPVDLPAAETVQTQPMAEPIKPFIKPVPETLGAPPPLPGTDAALGDN